MTSPTEPRVTTRQFAQRFLRLPSPGGGLMPMRWHPAQRAWLDQWDARQADGRRQYPEGLISWPKQSFKTTTGQVALLADLYAGVGPDREYVIVSSGLTQAGDVGFAGLVRLVERSPALRKVSKIYATELVHEQRIQEPTGGSGERHDSAQAGLVLAAL